MTADQRQHAPATLRNRAPIAEVLDTIVPPAGLVLEVASGTGEHAVAFARRFPSLRWQPTDPSPEALGSIAAWRAAEGPDNLLPPLSLDAAGENWPVDHADMIVCINLLHISPWETTLGLLAGAARVLPPGAPLFIYGPFRRRTRPLEPGNQAFDQSLRCSDPRWGLRELEEVTGQAQARGLALESVIAMPANNLSVVFRSALP